MPQIYKIYFNTQTIFLAKTLPTDWVPVPDGISHTWQGAKKELKLLKGQFFDQKISELWIFSDDLPKLKKSFFSLFKVVEAAGGWVANADGQLLIFYRRGNWDLPKGKIDPGETPPIAAVREVQEETGLKHVDLGAFLLHSYHLYPFKGDMVLKKTWWYFMTTTDTDLVPQTEEDIEKILWTNPENCLSGEMEVYNSLKAVVMAGMDHKKMPA